MMIKRSETERPKFQYAGFLIRFSAFLLDFLILWTPAFFFQFVSLRLGSRLLYYLIPLAYIMLVVYMDGIKGGTPGKLILGLKIVNNNGAFIGIPKAILRYMGKILSAIILGIGFFMIIWDKRKQSLHDKIAGTFVMINTANRIIKIG
ncbi:RDD family protein [Candidatus Woesearchaeota archaeon]|nr:RDD family protein [Candidatus Woesearchaeota archaeon]